jgi:hypothetical protein
VTPFADPIKQTIRVTVRAMNEAWTKENPGDLFHVFPRQGRRTVAGRGRSFFPLFGLSA